MLLFAFFLHLLPPCLLASGPTVEALDKMICPPDKPNKCLPYGVCCGYDQFCYSGMCESCLPHHLQEHEQLNWCRQHGVHNVSLMRDPSCRVACQAKFTPHELNGHSKTKTKEDTHNNCSPGEVKPADNTWFHLFLAVSVACCVFLILLLAVAVLSLMMYRNILLRHRRDRFGALERSSKRHHRRRHGAVSDGEETGDRYVSLEPESPPEVPPPRTTSFANGKYQPRLGSEVKDNLENECEALTSQSQSSG
ncbi:unnamed protein product [Lymnaea stagnalis]|uniref:Uncharacterized protein n=1 Tax=Lymnaea stagnalis TaxID=6523 RepID=A0AAV2II38_LYMST